MYIYAVIDHLKSANHVFLCIIYAKKLIITKCHYWKFIPCLAQRIFKSSSGLGIIYVVRNFSTFRASRYDMMIVSSLCLFRLSLECTFVSQYKNSHIKTPSRNSLDVPTTISPDSFHLYIIFSYIRHAFNNQDRRYTARQITERI